MLLHHETIQRLFKIRSEIQEVYWNLTLQTFAASLIGLFIPIYLLILGSSLREMLLFTLFYYLALAGLSPLSAVLTRRSGSKHLILYRTPLFLLFYGLLAALQLLPPSLALLIPVALVGGFSAALYYVPLMVHFATHTKKIHEGEEAATINALPRLFSIAAPTLAALILAAAGFPILFAISMAIVLVSVIPLFATGERKESFPSSPLRLGPHRRLLAQLSLKGVLLMSEAILWPVYIFLTLGNILDVGIAVSIAAAGTGLLTILLGRLSDRMGHRRLLIKLGGLAYGTVWIARLFSSTPLEIFLLSLLGGMFATILLEIGVFASFCDRARGKGVLFWVTAREIMLGAGRVVLFLILFLASGQEFTAAFLTAAIASFLFLLI